VAREAVGRPWITLAIDVVTRMVTGFHLAIEPPSRTSTGLCLLHAVYDKTAWLVERGIDASVAFRRRCTSITVPTFAAAHSSGPAEIMESRSGGAHGRAPFRWAYRAPDWHGNGCRAAPAWIDIQRSSRPRLIQVGLSSTDDAA
jgi:transposase InsO family protein